jgi:hypothetical protein
MGQSDDTESTAGRHDRGNIMLATALVLAALVVLVAASMVLAPTGSDGITSQPVDRSDTDVVSEGLSLVFIESRDTLDPSYDPVFTAPDSGDDPPPINYTTVAALLDSHPFTDEQVVQTQYLMSSLAHRTIGGSIASLEPVTDRTTTGMLVRLGTNDSREFTDETVLAENATGVQDLVFVLERESLPTSADNATTVEVGDWTLAAHQTQNRVRYQLGSHEPDGDWRETGEYTDLWVNTYQRTVNGDPVDSLAVDPGEQGFTVQVVDDRRSDGDSASGSLNLVAVGAGPGDVGNLPGGTWQEVVTRPAFNVTYIDATTTFVDRISVDTAYRAFNFAVGASQPRLENVTLAVETENTSQLIKPETFDGAGGTHSIAGRSEGRGVSPARAGKGGPPSRQEVWDSGNVWLPDYALESETEYTATVTINTSDKAGHLNESLLSLHTRDANGTLEPCECAEITLTDATTNTSSFLIDPYALRETLVLEANTSGLPGVETNVIRELTIVDPYRKPDVALEETAQIGALVQTDRNQGAFRLLPRNTSVGGTQHAGLQGLSLSSLPAQAVTRYIAENAEGGTLTSVQVGAAVNGLETLREQYASAVFNQSRNKTALLENFSAASPAEQAAMVGLTGVQAERAIPAFAAINEVVGSEVVTGPDIFEASSPAYAAGAGALLGEPYTASKLPMLADRASHAFVPIEHPPKWWLNQLAGTDLNNSQRATIGQLYGGDDPPDWVSPGAWNETILTFINNIRQFRGATETLWSESVSDATLRDVMGKVSSGNETLKTAIPDVHEEMEDASNLGVNPTVGAGPNDTEGFLLAAGLTDPTGATYKSAASLIDTLDTDSQPVTYFNVLFGVAGEAVKLLNDTALGETPSTYELAPDADLTADWDAALMATYTERSDEHEHTLGPYRASDVVTVTGVSNTEVTDLSVRFEASASAAALQDSGLLNGSGVGPQPLVVDQPREFRVNVTYENGSTETLNNPVEAGVSLALAGPTGGGGANVPSGPEGFATLDTEATTVTPQVATGNWSGDGSSGPITLQASLGALTDTAEAPAVAVSTRGAALWQNLSQSGGALAPGATPRTTVYSDAAGFRRAVLSPGLVYTARQGSPATGWHNRTGVPVSPAEVGSVTNSNETAANFYTNTGGTPVTEPFTLVGQSPSDGWENMTVQNITESAALNLSALGYAAPTYDAAAEYKVTCTCGGGGRNQPDNPHIMTAPAVAHDDRRAVNPAADGAAGETVSYKNEYEVPLEDPKPEWDRITQTPSQTIELSQTGNIYVWSNFRAADVAANNPDRLEDGSAGWRNYKGCDYERKGGLDSDPCWKEPLGVVDHTGTSIPWTSSLTQIGTVPSVITTTSQVTGGGNTHQYNVTMEGNLDETKHISIQVTGDSGILGDGAKVNSPTWNITVPVDDKDDNPSLPGGDDPTGLSLDVPSGPVLPGQPFEADVTLENANDEKITVSTVTLSSSAGGGESWPNVAIPAGDTITFSTMLTPGLSGTVIVEASAGSLTTSAEIPIAS